MNDRSEPTPPKATTPLSQVIYRPSEASPGEGEWYELLRGVAARQLPALAALYERAGRLVYILAFRISGDRAQAGEITIEVFEDVWRRAWSYQVEGGTVLAWIMNQARTRAREHAGAASRFGSPEATSVPADELRPDEGIRERLVARLSQGAHAEASQPTGTPWREPDWKQVAPDIECKVLARDDERDRVSMLVRLTPNGEYPPHAHAGVEELHLLEGELFINGHKLLPGEYNRAEAGTADQSVRTDTGCSCVLITSTRDQLG